MPKPLGIPTGFDFILIRMRVLSNSGRCSGRGRQMASARHLLADAALRNGDRLAVASGRSRATYAELDVRSGRLAAALIERGMRSGERIAVLMGDSLEAVVAICAALKGSAVLV